MEHFGTAWPSRWKVAWRNPMTKPGHRDGGKQADASDRKLAYGPPAATPQEPMLITLDCQ